MFDFNRIVGFQWDEGNTNKNFHLHGVEDFEAEQIFLDPQLLVLDDINHSEDEARYNALGVTRRGRFLHVTFTMRNFNTSIRIISARDMERNEEVQYVREGT